METRSDFTSRGMTFGNQLRRWHGTDRGCDIGDGGKTAFCDSAQCSLCCILQSSFDVSLAKKKTGWGRFGCGIYTSSASSKFVGPLVDRLNLSDLCRSQGKRLQRKCRDFSLQSPVTCLRGGRESGGIHHQQTFIDAAACGL